MQELVETFIANNDVEFKLVAVVNGEEVLQYSSHQSFDDVSGFAALADDGFDKYVVANAEDKADLEAEGRLDDLLDDERGL